MSKKLISNKQPKIMGIKIPIEIVLYEKKMLLSNLDNLINQGQITTDKTLNDRFYIKIGDEKIAYGKLVKKDKNIFFKIDEIINNN